MLCDYILILRYYRYTIGGLDESDPSLVKLLVPLATNAQATQEFIDHFCRILEL